MQLRTSEYGLYGEWEQLCHWAPDGSTDTFSKPLTDPPFPTAPHYLPSFECQKNRADSGCFLGGMSNRWPWKVLIPT
jgi:hypothetical protein